MTSHGRVKTPPQDGLLDNIWQPLLMPLLSFSPLCSGPLAILPVELLESCSTGAATSSTMAKIAQFGETDYLTTPLWVQNLGDLCRMSGVCTMNILWSVSCLRLYLRLQKMQWIILNYCMPAFRLLLFCQYAEVSTKQLWPQCCAPPQILALWWPMERENSQCS